MATKLEQVARGLLIDALITYVAILKERKCSIDGAVDAWELACREHVENVSDGGSDGASRLDKLLDASFGEPIVDDEHLEILIEERRGLIRETMRAELEALDDADPRASTPDGGEIQREVEG